MVVQAKILWRSGAARRGSASRTIEPGSPYWIRASSHANGLPLSERVIQCTLLHRRRGPRGSREKIRDAGGLGPDRVIGVFGVGGLGAYAVQYAKLLGAGATVVAFARNPDKLA